MGFEILDYFITGKDLVESCYNFSNRYWNIGFEPDDVVSPAGIFSIAPVVDVIPDAVGTIYHIWGLLFKQRVVFKP
jgi:hypothetical protein